MINILTLALVVAIVVSAVLGSIAVQVAAFVALMLIATIFAIVGRVHGEQEEIGLPDHDGSQIGLAFEEFLESEVKAEIANPKSIIGAPARYYSVRLGGERSAEVDAYVGRGIYDLTIADAAGDLVTIRRHRDNFQLA